MRMNKANPQQRKPRNFSPSGRAPMHTGKGDIAWCYCCSVRCLFVKEEEEEQEEEEDNGGKFSSEK